MINFRLVCIIYWESLLESLQMISLVYDWSHFTRSLTLQFSLSNNHRDKNVNQVSIGYVRSL